MKNRAHGLLIKIAVFFAALIFAFVLAELFFRTYGHYAHIDFRLYNKELLSSDRLPEDMFYDDPAIGKLLRPGASVLAVNSDFAVPYEINSHGMRDKEYTSRKAGKIRYLALGDSYTFGEGIPYGNRFADIPEEQLNDIEILDAGIPGFGLDQELILLSKAVPSYSPDYVIIFINDQQVYRDSIHFTGDGLRDSVLNGKYYADLSNYQNKSELRKMDEDSKMAKSSYFLSYLTFYINRFRLMDKLKRDDELVWKISTDKYSAGDAAASDVNLEKKANEILRLIHEITSEKNATLIIINIDDSHYFNYSNVIPQGIAYYEFAEDLQKSRVPLHFTYDSHYNPATHRLLGPNITEILKNERKNVS